ncbi:hypothetical protein KFU94_14600 [Chloroflexi bacterium TSY]|nr:hypothetical protein [Chloroflexi bacterium TSY]
MTVQFSHSVRSIQADNLRPILIGTAFFVVLMFGWALWFFLAAIPNYENSTSATYRQDGYVMADFSSTAFGRLQRGQSAQFTPLATDSTKVVIPMIITDVYPETTQAQLVLRVEDDNVFPIQPGITGEVKVVVERISPARVVLRSAGLLPDS